MLTQYRKTVCLSLMSVDLPVSSVVETAATLYQKDRNRFHLLLSAPPVNILDSENINNLEQDDANSSNNTQQWWLEITPEQAIMTIQGNGRLSYRHFWQQGAYGRTRYWLPNESSQQNEPIRLHNFTRHLTLNGDPFPENLRIEYELWAGEVQLGSYILNLEIRH
ncbi:hypothetical protein WA1_11610 [Scytonema hofmannii PCC 7110]|uniref:Uncharacterized protein n=1 Tax=Scytonema hofmannii PCC 7110 TaxID=128403 RepID=A0A139XDL9_9CYAN|nr:hypothetical protein [Scytonema hofmannii]KYC42775.1 hypothetical protein WA1_11610 [Scytonema hofmannii PCC 7110]